MDTRILEKLASPGYLQAMAEALVKEAVVARLDNKPLHPQAKAAIQILELFRRIMRGEIAVSDMEEIHEPYPVHSYFDPATRESRGYLTQKRVIYKITTHKP